MEIASAHNATLVFIKRFLSFLEIVTTAQRDLRPPAFQTAPYLPQGACLRVNPFIRSHSDSGPTLHLKNQLANRRHATWQKGGAAELPGRCCAGNMTAPILICSLTCLFHQGRLTQHRLVE